MINIPLGYDTCSVNSHLLFTGVYQTYEFNRSKMVHRIASNENIF